MKYTLLCLALSTAFVSSAYASPKITGTLKAHLMSDNYSATINNLTKGTSNKQTLGRHTLDGSSRLKFSGSNKINDVLTASYSLEYNLKLDDNSNTNFSPRSTYASLDHKTYGRIRYGRMTSPENDFDMGAAQSSLVGGLLPFTNFGVRSDNALQYYTPYFGKDNSIRVKLHYGMDENQDDTRVTTYVNNSKRTIRRDMAAAQITYSNKKMGLGLAYSRAGEDFNAISGMASIKQDKWRAGVVARVADLNSQHKEMGVLGSLSYNLENAWQAYGQLGYTENFEGRKGYLASGALGISKELKVSSGKANVFAEVAGDRAKDEERSRSSGDLIETKASTYGAAVGLNYRF